MTTSKKHQTTNIQTASNEINLEQPHYYTNRELSHLRFHLRVLEQAKDETVPLLERLKFLLIFDSNLDEFFEIRVAGLKKHLAYNQGNLGPDALPTREVLKRISDICHNAVTEQYTILNKTLFPSLRKKNIFFLRRSEWSESQATWTRHYFREQVFPVMSPIGLDPAHPFPRLANKSLNFIVTLKGKDAFGRQSGLAIVPAPRSLPRLIQFPDEICGEGTYFAFLSAMIHAHANDFFPGMEVQGCYQFRLTRNSDLHLDEDVVEDLAMALKGELLSRHFGDEVRLEVADNCPENLAEFLLKQFNLEPHELYRVPGMVNLSRMMSVTEIELPTLRYPPFSPGIPKNLKTGSLFDLLEKQDILLYHPFDSFQPVIDLLRQAARDPNVLAIKQTLYRIGSDSEVMNLLLEAALNGKEVTAVVELRARFDEQRNLDGATALQKAGALVAYGIVGYKTHCKMILIVRREGTQLKRYLHLGTGNYHPGNARVYTDFSLMTSNNEMTNDAHHVFQQLTGMGRAAKLIHLMHAPFTLHTKLISLIEQEAHNAQQGKASHIIIKVNGITEPKVIQSLYKASRAGVKIDLIVRGICCLKPKIPGISDHINIISIVGRFLEHSRVYYFLHGGKELVYLSSADLMSRNLFNRVETAFPVMDKKLKKRVIQIGLKTYLKDNHDAWQLQNNEEYIKPKLEQGKEPICAQQTLLTEMAKIR